MPASHRMDIGVDILLLLKRAQRDKIDIPAADANLQRMVVFRVPLRDVPYDLSAYFRKADKALAHRS